MSPSVPHNPDIHPFLRGNFAPVTEEYVSHPCSVIHGEIPKALLGGQYIRNGGNPVYPPEKGRHYHWFDGDGMLHGVLFPVSNRESPIYTNRHLVTPLLTLTLLLLRSPIPSIALLISPLSSLHRVVSAIVRAVLLAIRAQLGVLSVANTNVIWWGRGLGSESSGRAVSLDHRLLATCESGPPLEVRVPSLETVGWDRLSDGAGESLKTYSGSPWWTWWLLPRIQEDWMTAHPRVDPVDGSLIFYSTQMFQAPHARYSVIDSAGRHRVWKAGIDIGRAKMMHDFACTRTHTILLNLPLTLSPANLFTRKPVPLLHFDRSLPSEFIVFPRLLGSLETPQEPLRFIDPEPCLIFHTANAWNNVGTAEQPSISMLGCRFLSAKLVYAAGAVEAPPEERSAGDADIVRLHYYRFALPNGYNENRHITQYGEIADSFPLTDIPFEFPTISPQVSMTESRYVYGCTMRSGSFDERLGGAAKVDCLVKIDVRELIRKGCRNGNRPNDPVDPRDTAQILEDWRQGRKGPVEVFALPLGFYAQEPRFVPRSPKSEREDDGFILTYVYDEHYLIADGTPSLQAGSGSELWVIDATYMGDGMDALVCRIKLPQRIPYGLHGTWIPPKMAERQRQISAPLDQPLLQDKLARSRLSHFASILFDRPADRHRSKFERVILNIMWPASIGMLLLAMIEMSKAFLPRSLFGLESKLGNEQRLFFWAHFISVALLLLAYGVGKIRRKMKI